MNIEITDWEIESGRETLNITYRIDDGDEIDITIVGDELYNSLVEAGVFNSFENGIFKSDNPVSCNVAFFWYNFNQFIDTRVMRELVKLKIKQHEQRN